MPLKFIASIGGILLVVISSRAAPPGQVKSEFIFESAPFPSCHASTIVETTERKLVSAWFGGTAEGKPDVGIWVSHLEGGRWSALVEVATGIQEDGKRWPCWNPVLFQPSKRDLMLFYKVGPSPSEWWGMLRTSTNNGRTWSAATRLPKGILGPIKNKPIELADGTILSGSSSEGNRPAPSWRLHFERSFDGGKSWDHIAVPVIKESPDAIQPSILTHPDGHLQAIGRTRSGKIFSTSSKDNGKTWSELALTSLPNPNSGTDAVTLKDGRHLLIYNHTPRGRSPLNLAISKDGIDWQPAMALETESGEYSYPAIIQTSDGLVHATYTWKRQRVKHVVIDPAKLEGANSDELIVAARKGDLAAVRKLLDAGADVNSTTEYGATALHFAADKGHLDIVKLLIERKANINAKDKFYSATPLTWASMRDRATITGTLLAAGATGGDGILISAARSGNADMVITVLINGKPKPETLTSALKAAEKPELAELLRKAGAKEPEQPKVAAKPEDLTPYTGTFKNPDAGEVAIKTETGGLAIEVDGRKVFSMTREKAESFKADGASVTAEFQLSNGVVTAFTLKSENQKDRVFERVKASAQASDRTNPATVAIDPVPNVKAPANWPQFRGIGAGGVAEGQFPPTNFDVPKGQNVLWKTPIPGLGHSCPVVWGDKVFLTSSIGDPKATLKPGQYGDVDSVKEEMVHEWHVICLDKLSGKVLWDRIACKGVPKIKRHLKGTHANSTPATDGRHLVVNFGAEGLFCYDFNGRQLWKCDLGNLESGWFYDPDYQWGFGSSPVVYGNKAFVQCDAGKNSFIAAYNVESGSLIWKTPREEPPSWSSPTVVSTADRTDLVASGTKFARGYDTDTGKELWKIGRLSEISVPTPFLAQGLIFIVSGYRPVQPIFAIKPGAVGDISPKDDKTSGDKLAWSSKTGGSYMATPLVYGDYLYVLANSGLLTCWDAKTGKKKYSERVGGAGGYTASLVAADGRLYCIGETAGVRVVKAGAEYELMAVNPVGETCMATPAISDGVLFLRTEKHLIALGVPRSR